MILVEPPCTSAGIGEQRAGGPPERRGQDPLGWLERRLLNDFQRDFPLQPRPFAAIGESLGVGEARVLATLRDLHERGLVRRVGPVLRPRRFGASTLAAMRVPAARLDEVAALVSACPEVNHNYEREHPFNLWFVVTGCDRVAVTATLAAIEEHSGLRVLDLPLVNAFHIDLGFDLFQQQRRRRVPVRREQAEMRTPQYADASEQALIAAMQDGIALEAQPFRRVARAAGMHEAQVLERLAELLRTGDVKRFGVIVDHARLGYVANAMVVWDVPDGVVGDVARRLAGHSAVTLCYQRPRRRPEWPFNLFCMIHGRDRGSVLAALSRIAAEEGLQSLHREVLFSVRRFKQCGARYVPGAGPA